MVENLFLYTGTVSHRRIVPKYHAFSYNVLMFYFDISRIEETLQKIPYVSFEKFNWYSFHRKNYLNNNELSLDNATRELIKSKFNTYPKGKIYLLTQLSCFGYCFNPISLYFVFKENSDELEYLITEVTNTPWGEKHQYVLSNTFKQQTHFYQYHFEKELHVSPFMGMKYIYQLNLKFDHKNINVYLKNIYLNQLHFDASLCLQASTFNTKTFIRHPLMTYKIIFAIYWQALKLWIKGAPYHPHP